MKIANIEVSPGERKIGWIDVTKRASGETLRIAVNILRGLKDGPVLGLVGILHGDAAYGVVIEKAVLDSIDIKSLKGTILAMPVGNPIAFESFTRTTGQGMNTDKNNMNRVFPGDPGGWVTEQMADAISMHFVTHLDYLIDFHSGDLSNAINYILVETPENEAGEQGVLLSKLYGTDILFLMDSPAHHGTLVQYAQSKGIPSVIAEIGGCVAFDDEHLSRFVQGVKNIMIHVGMMDGEIVLPAKQYMLHRRVLIRPKNGGLFVPEVGFEKLSKNVPGGTVLGRVISPHTFEELESFVAPYDDTTLIMMRGVLSRVNPGDYGYILGDWSSAEIITN